jgi:hypothetical protein
MERGRVTAERLNEAFVAGVGKDQPSRHPTTHQPTQLQQAPKQRRAQALNPLLTSPR